MVRRATGDPEGICKSDLLQQPPGVVLLENKYTRLRGKGLLTS